MPKRLNEEILGNELRASAFFAGAQAPGEAPSPTLPQKSANKPETEKVQEDPQASRIASTQPKNPITVKVENVDSSPILGRPKAFYITEDQDRDLDALVAELSVRLAGRLNFKVDRSVVVRLILESSNLTGDKTIDRLAGELVRRLVCRLTG